MAKGIKSPQKNRIKKKNSYLITKDYTCMDYQKLNHQYIYGKLTFKDEVAFVNHIRSCADCSEELKSYFTFSTALSFLEPGNKFEKMSTNVEELLQATERKHADTYKSDRILYGISAFVGVIIGVIIGIVFTGGL